MTYQEKKDINRKLDDALYNLSALMDRNNIVMESGFVERDQRIDKALVSIKAGLMRSKAQLSN